MARGERIGDAYIRIHADGSGFDRELRREFDPIIRGAGKSGGKTYAEAFNEELNRRGKANLITFAGEINKSLGRFHAGQEFTQRFTGALDQLRDKVGKEHGPEIGQRLADSIREKMIKGVIQTRDEYLAEIADLTPAITRITKEIDAEQQQILDEMVREQKRRLAEIEREEKETSDEILKSRRTLAKEVITLVNQRAQAEERALQQERQAVADVSAFRNRMWQQRIREDKEARKSLQALIDTTVRLSKGEQQFGESVSRSRRRLAELTDQFRALNDESPEAAETLRKIRFGLITMSPHLTRAHRNWNRFADSIGRFSGRGSRNDFLNFIGSINRNVTRFIGNLTIGMGRATLAVGRFVREVATGGLKFRDFIDLVKNGATALAGGLSTLVGVAAILGLLIGTASVLTAVLSGLVAVLTALVSTVAFAAASALPALTAAFLPLVAVVGVGIAAFKSLSEAQKEALQNNLKPVTNALKDLGEAAADVLFQDVSKWAKDLKPILESLRPAVVGVARAIRDSITAALDNAANSPKFQNFVERFNTFLPNAVRKLGTVMTNVFEGVGGLLRAMVPSMNRFLRWLIDVTDRFSDWANDRAGREQIRTFFQNAGDSAAALGDFLKQVVKFVAQLISQSRQTGDGLFRDMADAIQEAVDWLTSPEGRKAMKDWMEFARDFGAALGRVVVATIDFIDALDNPTTRSIATFLLGAFEKILGFLAKYPQVMLAAFGPLGVVAALVITIKNAFADVFDWLSKIVSLSPLGGLADAISGIAGGIKSLFTGGDESLGRYISSLGELAQEHAEVASKTAQAQQGYRDLAATLDQVTGAATDATRALALQQLQENGVITTGRALGFSVRTLTQAFSGNRAAIQDLQLSGRQLKNLTGEQRLAYGLLLQKLGLSTAALRRERSQILLNNAATRDYTGKLKGIPQRVKTLIQTSDVKATVKSLGAVIAKARELAPNLKLRQIKTIIEATGAEPTQKLIEKVIKKADELKKEREARIGADTKAFDAREKRVRQMLTALETRPPVKPTVDLNDDPARNKAAALLNYLNGLNPQPIVQDVVFNYVGKRPGGGSGGSTTSSTEENSRTGTTGKVIAPVFNVTTPGSDPRAVAQELLNRLAGAGY